MGRGARAVCVSFPLLATAAAAALIVISTFIGQTKSSSGWLNSLYFLRLDTRYIDAPSQLGDIQGTSWDNYIEGKTGADQYLNIQGTAKLIGADDFYQAGLFGYCSGTFDNTTGNWNVNQCSKPSGTFVFNIIDIINSQIKSGTNLTFPKEVNDYFKGVAALTRAQYICFVIGIIATGVEFVLGFFGFLSRWGSCVTTIVASFAFLALLGGAVINVALYAALAKTFDATFKTFGVKGEINRQVYILMYVGVLMSLFAAVFWMLSTCCCSGRRDKIMGREKQASRGPKNYERVPSPYMGSGPAPAPVPYNYGQQQYGHKESPYEPMRHAQV